MDRTEVQTLIEKLKQSRPSDWFGESNCFGDRNVSRYTLDEGTFTFRLARFRVSEQSGPNDSSYMLTVYSSFDSSRSIAVAKESHDDKEKPLRGLYEYISREVNEGVSFQIEDAKVRFRKEYLE